MDEEDRREQLAGQVTEPDPGIVETDPSGDDNRETGGDVIEAREKFRAIFDASLDALMIIEAASGRILEVNPATGRIFRLEEGDIIGKHYSVLFPPEVESTDTVAPSPFQVFGEVFTQKFLRGDGEIRSMDLTATLIPYGEEGAILASFRDVSEREATEAALRKRTIDLRKRVDELNCLYVISGYLERRDLSLADILLGITTVIPPAWQYPELTCVRITLGNREFHSDNFRETGWRLGRDILIRGQRAGILEVFYLEERPEANDGPFLREETRLLELIAERIGLAVERKRWEGRLNKTHDELRESNRRLETAYAQMRDWKDRLSLQMHGEEIGFLVGRDGKIMGVTGKAVESTGRSRAELLDSNLLDLLDSASRETLAHGLREAWIGISHQNSVTMDLPSGEKRFGVKLMEMNEKGERMLLVLMRP